MEDGISILNSSLYVGDLHPEVTESLLFRIFSTIGNVASVRLMRDFSTKKSLGYAYVNFHTPKEAEIALDTINYEFVYGRPIRLMRCHRDPSTRKKIDSNVFIKNLDPEIDTKTLRDAFSIFGSIYSCKVCYDENGVSKGYGFVHFNNTADAENALEKMNGFQMGERKIFVGKFMPRMSMFLDSNKNLDDQERKEIICRGKNFNNLYVKNFPKEFTDQDFVNLFREFGTIISAKIMRKQNGSSKGFGFVCYENGYSSKNAIMELNSKLLDNQKKPLVVTYAEKKIERVQKLKKLYTYDKNNNKTAQKTNIYVKNLHDDITEDGLLKLFKPFGEVASYILIRKNESVTGAALINYFNYEDAKNAIESLNGKFVVSKPLFVAFAQTKEERRKMLDDMFQKNRQHQTTAAATGPGAAAAVAASTSAATSAATTAYQYVNYDTINGNVAAPHTLFPNCPPILSTQHPFVSSKAHLFPSLSENSAPAAVQPKPFSFPRLLGIIRPSVSIPIAPYDATNAPSDSSLSTIYKNYSPPSPKLFNYHSNYSRSRNHVSKYQHNRVLNKVQQMSGKWAPKVTRMLLDLETPLLNDLLSNDNNFRDKVNEYVQLLES